MKTGELEIFDIIRSERPFVSEISNRDLSVFYNTSFYVNCFAHIIPKNGCNRLVFIDKQAKNKILRLNKDNIMLLHPEEHSLVDVGTEKLRDLYATKYPSTNFDIFFNKKEELIESIKSNYSMYLR